MCIADKRQDILSKKKDLIPEGVYLKDIAEVREGSNSYAFECYDGEQTETESVRYSRSLALIGTENTFCLEMVNQVGTVNFS